MKLTILIVVFGFLSMVSLGQFREYKSDYSVKGYKYLPSDKYSPGKAAALAILPGAGHFYCGQPLRGLIFPAGMFCSGVLVISGSLENWADRWDSDPNDGGKGKIIAGEIAFIGFYVLNFIDASRVAKIKNLHFREQEVTFNFKPCFNFDEKNNSAGLALQITF